MIFIATIIPLCGAALAMILLQRVRHGRLQLDQFDKTDIGRIMIYDKRGRYVGQIKF